MMQSLVVLAAVQLLSTTATAQTLRFSSDSAVAFEVSATGEDSGKPRAVNVASSQSSGVSVVTSGSALERQDLVSQGLYLRTCKCNPARSVRVDDIRAISDEFCSDGNDASTAGLSNMVWGFGQFLDHDLALTIEDEESSSIEVEAKNTFMELHRAVTQKRGRCSNTINAHTPQVDAGPIYGSDRIYMQRTLRQPGTCYMRTADGGFLPLTTNADDAGRFFFIAGDVRVSEHAFLASQHTVWVREHNRLCDVVNADTRNRGMSSSRKFDLVRRIVIAKFQQVVLEEFLPALGITQQDLEDAEAKARGRGVSVEFSIAYRLGHDLIGNDVGGIDIADAFNAESFFLEHSGTAAKPSVTYKDNAESNLSNIMTQLSKTKANEIDGRLSDALRNFLFGRGEGQDLAGRNIFRGRELGVPSYADLADCFGIKHDATVEAETPDAWLGLLREPKTAGQPLPPTLRAIVVEQFHRSFFGIGGNYWKSPANFFRVRSYADEIESSTYSKIIAANTGADVVSGSNVFKT